MPKKSATAKTTKTKKNKKVAEPTPVAKIKTSLNLIYKISNYIKLKEFKTDKK